MWVGAVNPDASEMSSTGRQSAGAEAPTHMFLPIMNKLPHSKGLSNFLYESCRRGQRLRAIPNQGLFHVDEQVLIRTHGEVRSREFGFFP